MILIVCDHGDPHGRAIEKEIKHRGGSVAVFNHSDFPADAEFSFSIENGKGMKRSLRMADGTIDIKSIKAVWLGLTGKPQAGQKIQGEVERAFVQCASEYFLWDIWQTTDCLWVPGSWSRLIRSENKMSQLKLALEIGFEIPPTLVSNSPADFAAFYREHNGDLISKVVHTRAWRSISEYDPLGYTQVVSKRDAAYAHTLQHCPSTFQAYVPKRFELRITVVGTRIFAAEIHSQESGRTRDDWRRYYHRPPPYRVHELPRDIERKCLAIVEALGLSFGAIDMIVTPDQRYIFLEINTLGAAWLWAERNTQMPITSAICDVLMEAKPLAQSLGGMEADRNG